MRSVRLGDICDFKYGKSLPDKDRVAGEAPVFGSNGVVGKHAVSISTGPTIIIGRKGSAGKLNFSHFDCWPIDTTYYIDESCCKQNLRWLYHTLDSLRLHELNNATGIPGLNRNDAYERTLIVPNLSEQERIATVLDQADDLRRKSVAIENSVSALKFATFRTMFGDPNLLGRADGCRLGDVCDISSGSTPSRSHALNFEGSVPWVKTGEVRGGIILDTEEHISETARQKSGLKIYPSGTVLMAMYGQGKTRGQVGMLGIPATTNQACAAIVCSSKISAKFLFVQLQMMYEKIRNFGQGGNQPNLNGSLVKDLRVNMPSADRQKEFETFASHCERLVADRTNAAKNYQALFTSLQHRAFRGEL